ncbi:MAG: FHA domain-containing protein [Oscillospiraceae bacterium]|nr:FHA domain-containing protein [Oscillospiraceae bacterium]
MIQFTVVQKGSSQYLVYDLQGSNRAIDDISVMMINSNQKKNGSIAKISFDELNGEKQRILFEITGMVTLTEYLRRKETQESFRQLILSIVSAIDGLSEYMIDADQVLLNTDYVFINYVTRQVTFICLPFTDKSDLPTTDLYGFFRQVFTISVPTVELHAGEISYSNMVMNAMGNPAGFSLDNIRKVLEPDQMPQQQAPQSVQVMTQSAFEPAAASAAGDVAFEPGVAFPQPPAPKEPKGGKKEKGKKKEKEKADANVQPVPMPDDADKEDKGLFGKLKKKFKKKDSEEEVSGGLSDLASGKPKQPVPTPAQPPVQQPPVPQQPPVQPQAPVASPIPQSANTAPNHTILIPSGSPVQPLSPQGIAAMSARMDQAQQNLFSAPAPNAIPQTPDMNNVLGGGMSGLPAVGLPPVQTPPPVQLPPDVAPDSADEADPKTVVMFPDDDKTVLMHKSYLIRKRDGSKFTLEQPLIRVGRNRPDVEINLRGNNHVGHMHASLLMVGGSYAVVDHESVNHTYLNHQQLEPQKQYPLKNGDILAFADEEFEFQTEG